MTVDPFADHELFATEEHRLFRESVRRFIQEEVAPRAREFDQLGRIDKALYARMGSLGMLGIRYDPAYGGGGLDWSFSAILAEELARRLASIFLRDKDGRRPVYGGTQKFQEDPHWRDLILFYEYFHGDNGAGLGASHQTGWTGIVARIMHLFATRTADQFLEQGKEAGVVEAEPAPARRAEGG